MDRWILARCQSLIKLVKEEMAAYRLYTIIPRLLELIDELTNWYIRFNRKRLKGEDGEEDTIAALNALFEALFTLCRTMSSYTPFLTEHIYQSLRPFIPAGTLTGDTRSVHFVSFPDVKEEYFDIVIERQVKRMQSVIELTRNVREKNNCSLKTPLKELLVFHADEEYLEDVKSLQRYLQSELNVRDIIFTSDEDISGVRYRALADWGVLGKRLRKDIGRVKNALPNVPSNVIKTYVESGKLTVDGIELVAGDLTIQRYIELPTGSEQYGTHTDNDVVVRLDITVHEELLGESLARELINRIQKLRKKAGLQATDDVEIYFSMEDPAGRDVLLAAMNEHAETITKTVGSMPVNVEDKQKDRTVIIAEEQVVTSWKILLWLVRPVDTVKN